ncbi:MAG: tetratricopeptide repeat protein [Myxococcales bacterium]
MFEPRPPPPSPAPASVHPRHLWLAATFVGVTVAGVFARSLANGFVNWDDQVYILDNAHIRTLSWQTLHWAFTGDYASYWAPAVWLSFALDHAVWGLDPLGYHLTNVVLHAMNAALVCLLGTNLLAARRSAGRPWEPRREDLAGGVLAALLFGLHPLRVESVTWVTERKDVLAGLFALTSILAYLRWVNRRRCGAGSGPVPVGSLVALALAVCAKPLSVVVLPLLLLLDWHPLGRDSTDRLARFALEKVPHALVCLGAGLLFLRAQQTAMPTPATPQTRLYTACKVLVDYVWMQLWPADLVPLYPRRPDIPWDSPPHLLAMGILLAVAVLVTWSARRDRVLLAVALWHLISLAPVLGLLQVGPQEKADRYTYLASIGLALLVAGACVALWRRWPKAGARTALAGATGAVLLVLAGLTVRQIGIWKDGVTLWTRQLEVSPALGHAWELRGKAHAAKGELALAADDLSQAIAIAESKHYARTWELYWARGIVLSQAGRFDEAVGALSAALRGASPAPADLLRRRGEALRAVGRLDEARADQAAADEVERRRAP